MRKSNNSFIFCILIAIASLAIGIITLPLFNIAQNMLNALLALVLGACMIAFILPEIMSTRGIICVLNFFEFFLIAIVALLLVIQQVLPFLEMANARMLAVAIWVHGMIGIFKIYNTRVASMKKGLALPLLINIILITVSTYLFAAPFLSDAVIAWICSIFFFILTFLMVALSLLYAPQKAKKSAGK